MAQHLRGYSYTKYTVNDGLAANHVLSIAEDNNGFMWFSTSAAVQWFDGIHFHAIQQGQGLHELPIVSKVDIYTLTDKQLLLVYQTGFSIYQPQTHCFTHYLLQKNKTKNIFLKQKENLLLFLNGTQLQHYDIVQKKIITSTELSDKIKSNFIFTSAEQQEDEILLTDEAGNNIFINTKNATVKNFASSSFQLSLATANFYSNNTYISFTEKTISQKNSATNNIISSVNVPSTIKPELKSVLQNKKLADNLFVVTIGQHLLLYNVLTNKIVSEVVTIQKEPFLETGYTEVLYVDNHKNIWLCSNTQGVYKINYLPNNFKSYTPLNNKDFSIAVEASKEDNVVISGSYGQGIFIYDTAGNYKKQIALIDKQHPELTTITSVKRIAANEYILMGYGVSGVYKLNTLTYTVTTLTTVDAVTQKPLYSIGGSYYHKLIRAGIDSFYLQLTDNELYLLKVEGNTVVANNANVGKLEPFVKNKSTLAGYVAPKKFSLFYNNVLKTFNVFPDNISINSMAVTSDSAYYVATSQGLYKISFNGKLLAKFTQQTGLANDNIFSVVVDNDNNIWCGHYKGISKITSSGSITNLSAKDGLQDYEFNSNAVCKTNDGEIFFGGAGGINSFYPQLLTSVNETPKLKVVTLKAGNEFANSDTSFWNINELKVNYTNNLIQLSFNAIGKQSSSTYNYQYRLRNNDTSWVNLQQNNSILFTLQPGVYYLDLFAGRAYNKNAQAIKTIKIIITPPFYRTWFFIIFCSVIIVLLLVYLIQYFNKRKYRKQLEEIKVQQQLEEERKRISKDLHDTMGAYTSALLSNVHHLKKYATDTQETDLQKMQSNAEQILSSLRETIWVLNNQSISVSDFSDGFKNYCLKLLQNFDGIDFNAEENIQQNKIILAHTAVHLNKLLQEAIQNIIKHSKATSINYTLSSNHKLIISLNDNGKGFNVNNSLKGNGLENMHWRAAQAGYILTVASSQNGTTITIKEK